MDDIGHGLILYIIFGFGHKMWTMAEKPRVWLFEYTGGSRQSGRDPGSGGRQPGAALGKAEQNRHREAILNDPHPDLATAADKPVVYRHAPKLASLDPAKMLRIHGYRDLDAVRQDVRTAAERHAEEAMNLLELRFFYQRLPVEGLSDNQLALAGGATFNCGAFEKILKNSKEIIAFVLSTGRPLDDRIQAYLLEFGVLEALFLETAGWIAIEAATRMFALHLRREIAPDGLTLTARMGPGYAYNVGGVKVAWDLRDQRKLFGLFDGHPLPVTLLESCAMHPKLSRSGIFGLLPADKAQRPRS